jgi:hypothetical protein
LPAVLQAAGFFEVTIGSRCLPGLRFVSYHYWGEAREAA